MKKPMEKPLLKKVVMYKDKPYGVMYDEREYLTGIFVDLRGEGECQKISQRLKKS